MRGDYKNWGSKVKQDDKKCEIYHSNDAAKHNHMERRLHQPVQVKQCSCGAPLDSTLANKQLTPQIMCF